MNKESISHQGQAAHIHRNGENRLGVYQRRVGPEGNRPGGEFGKRHFGEDGLQTPHCSRFKTLGPGIV